LNVFTAFKAMALISSRSLFTSFFGMCT
jgi:hypothetical protein